MQVIAHRGASGHRPENTLPAYELAIQMRADMIEIDLHQTRDGAIVIAHDAELPGLGPGGAGQGGQQEGEAGEIGEASLEAVRALDAGEGERVPTLDEVLDGFAARIPFNLEIKWGAAGDYPGLEAQVLEALSARGLGESILFSSFRPSILRRLRDLDASARLALLVSPSDRNYSLDEALGTAGDLSCEALNPHWVQVEQELVGRAHEAGLTVNVYTVDKLQEMRRMMELGVDALFTNYPDRLRTLVDGG